MKDREPKQWHELLQIISEAKRDLDVKCQDVVYIRG